MRRLALTLGLLALVLTAPSVAAANAWTVDKARSVLGFKGQASGVGFEGRFRTWDAQITFDPDNLANARVVATVNVGSVATGNGERDALLPTAAFFDAARFPRATFVAGRFVSRGGNRYAATGDLTIKGITKPVTLPFTLAIDGDTAQMTGSVALNRSAFAVGTGQWASDDTIDRTVVVTINLTATKR
jgi:polyisoprenoid-binding protein YceI